MKKPTVMLLMASIFALGAFEASATGRNNDPNTAIAGAAAGAAVENDLTLKFRQDVATRQRQELNSVNLAGGGKAKSSIDFDPVIKTGGNKFVDGDTKVRVGVKTGNTTQRVVDQSTTQQTTGPVSQETGPVSQDTGDITIAGDQLVISHQAQKRDPVASAMAPSLSVHSQARLCLGSKTGGLQLIQVGVSAGGTHEDQNCVDDVWFNNFRNAGLNVAALEVACIADSGRYRVALKLEGYECGSGVAPAEEADAKPTLAQQATPPSDDLAKAAKHAAGTIVAEADISFGFVSDR
ncbi:MAG: hypothetical protein AAGA35_03805 [Patescibacteria group bacterium]